MLAFATNKTVLRRCRRLEAEVCPFEQLFSPVSLSMFALGSRAPLRLKVDALPMTWEGGNKMKPSSRNQMTGKTHEVKGTVKKAIGQVTNNLALEAEGLGEKITGKVQEKIGQIDKRLNLGLGDRSRIGGRS